MNGTSRMRRLLAGMLILGAVVGIVPYLFFERSGPSGIAGLLVSALLGLIFGLGFFVVTKLAIHYLLINFTRAASEVSGLVLPPMSMPWDKSNLDLIDDIFHRMMTYILQEDERHVKELEQSNDLLTRAVADLQLLHDISRSMFTMNDLDKNLQVDLQRVAEHFRATAGVILVSSLSGGELRVAAAAGLGPEATAVGSAAQYTLRVNDVLPAEPVIVNSPRAAIEAVVQPLDPEALSWVPSAAAAWVAPIVTTTSQVLGVLTLIFRNDQPLDDTATRTMRSITRYLGVAIVNASLYEQAQVQALTDGLTGVYNRRALDRLLLTDVALARRGERSLALLIVDIDHFKSINDAHGHRAGDQVIIGVADLLRSATRGGDIIARYGGDEFAILLHGGTLGAALEVAERVRVRIQQTRWFLNSGVSLGLTASIGVAECRDSTCQAGRLIDIADDALYRAKGDGRNRVSAGALVFEESDILPDVSSMTGQA